MAASPITNAQGVPYPDARARAAAAVSAAIAPRTAFRAADPMSQELGTWHPAPVSADTAIAYERMPIAGRIHDLVRNNGWASQAVRREIEAAIGANLRLSYTPDYEALGLDAEWAAEFKREVQGRWRVYANDPDKYCDAARRNTIPVLFAQAYRHAFVDGDALAVVRHRTDGRGMARTMLQVINPLRLSNPAGVPNADDIRSGVELDEDGAAVAYHIRDRHPYDAAAWSSPRQFRWTRVPRETPWGRPNVIHFFEADDAGQTRGATRLAALVEGLKAQDKYERTEMQAATVNALLAAYIESPMDTQQLMEGLSGGLDAGSAHGLSGYQALREAFHESARLTLGGVQLQHLFPGEKLGFHAAARPAGNYEPFVAAVLRKVAAASGLSYEQVAGDWSKTNYSSARAALLEVWRGLYMRRHMFTRGFCTPFFGCWLEEQVAEGRLDHVLPRNAPSFWEAKAAYVKADWIGPARGWVDPEKEAKAADQRMKPGINTWADEVSEQGKDPDEHRQALIAELAEFRKAGLVHPMDRAVATNSPAVATDDSRPEDEQGATT